ncbi:unnamed protein product [Caretta caretta]
MGTDNWGERSGGCMQVYNAKENILLFEVQNTIQVTYFKFDLQLPPPKRGIVSAASSSRFSKRTCPLRYAMVCSISEEQKTMKCMKRFSQQGSPLDMERYKHNEDSIQVDLNSAYHNQIVYWPISDCPVESRIQQIAVQCQENVLSSTKFQYTKSEGVKQGLWQRADNLSMV